MNRAGDFHAAVEVARHEIGGRNIILRIFIASELINTAMLQKASDDAGDMNILRLNDHTRQDAANAANDELDFNARAGSRCQLVDDLALGDGIGLDADIAALSQRNLPVNILKQHFFDAKRRYAELLICAVQLVDEHIAEKRSRVLADRLVGRHKAEICIHGVGLFVIVAGADLREVAGFVTIAKRDEADLAVALEALRTVDHLASGLLQHL